MITEFSGQVTVIIHDIPVKIILVFGCVIRFPEIDKPKRKAERKNKKNNRWFF